MVTEVELTVVALTLRGCPMGTEEIIREQQTVDYFAE